jgi:hypothetical protein
VHRKGLRSQRTFFISGIFGANRWEIWEITSWIKGWFFIVFRAFITLPRTFFFKMGFRGQEMTDRTMVA